MNLVRIVPIENREHGVAERIHAVQRLAYEQEAALLQVRYFPPLELTPGDIRSSNERFFGAFIGAELLGSGSISHNTGTNQRHIASLVVTPKCQRQGIGRLLLAAALSECKGAVITVSTGAKNSPALALYEEFGFVEYMRQTIGSEALELVKLRREGWISL